MHQSIYDNQQATNIPNYNKEIEIKKKKKNETAFHVGLRWG